MKKLVAYEIDQNDILQQIYKSKKAILKLNNSDDVYEVKSLVEGKYTEILGRYSEYDCHKNRLEDIGGSCLSEIEKQALIHCYEKPTKPLNNLKKKIKLNQPRGLRSICLYCGINNPGTYDHYIPKSDYPEYSVFGPNLIPCCSECNGKKGDTWRSKDNKRFFFNLYYDEIPDIQIIGAIITIENNEPKIRFEFIKNNGEFEYKRLKDDFIIESHYTKLNLLNRFRDSCNSYIDEIINSLIAHKKFDETSIKKFLDEEYQGIKETYGINHWKSITIKGMIDSADFIIYCSLL